MQKPTPLIRDKCLLKCASSYVLGCTVFEIAEFKSAHRSRGNCLVENYTLETHLKIGEQTENSISGCTVTQVCLPINKKNYVHHPVNCTNGYISVTHEQTNENTKWVAHSPCENACTDLSQTSMNASRNPWQ